MGRKSREKQQQKQAVAAMDPEAIARKHGELSAEEIALLQARGRQNMASVRREG